MLMYNCVHENVHTCMCELKLQDSVVFSQVVEEAIRPDTSLVSVMMVNNEIGVTQPIKEIG